MLLLKQKSLDSALRALSRIVHGWLDVTEDDTLRSYLIDARKRDVAEKPQEWQNEFRIGLHIELIPSDLLEELMINRYVSEVTFRDWQISINDASFDELQHDLLDVDMRKDPQDEAREILTALEDRNVAKAMRRLVEGTILWMHNYDLSLIKEDAILVGHYEEGMDEDTVRSHILRSFYMFFTGA